MRFQLDISKYIKLKKIPLLYSDHHLSHALCGLSYADKSKDWTIMVIDGVGDGETFSEYIFRDGKIKTPIISLTYNFRFK